ncbi:MAG: 3-isopropylmalate dehydratase large subunit [Bordetella sp. SCN 67-23]|nr:3-isopropylmalate dehydratase large subunit [Burkholderiales bacterium]ODS74681.1 MAG: 3-isopropylmalate dehydratase large subunit [Bordetella sp. SCN 67-23]OJW94397.1 MAG: 3-isopropylmalate dehydratase large subunit [Burkholderiales bacterium 67-32]
MVDTTRAAQRPRSMFEKIWARHVIAEREGGESLIYIDRNFVHEGPFYAFDGLRLENRRIHRPLKQFAIADHYAPTQHREAGVVAIQDPDIRRMIEQLEQNARDFGVPLIGMTDARQGIMHVVAAELALVQPGMITTAADSHTTSIGAFGALAFGVGASEIKHILATQSLWFRKPKTMRVTVEGSLSRGVAAKDVILAVVGRVGLSGGTGHVIEYAGPAISGMTMDERMTICNMSIEMGARAGMVAPDETTFAYLKGRQYAPSAEYWDQAMAFWRGLPTEPGAQFDQELSLDASRIEPMVTWGNLPEHALPISARVPHPDEAANEKQRGHYERALAYMQLEPGMRLTDVAVDRVFIGSCTNARFEDLAAAAEILRGRHAVVPAMVSPGSTDVKRRAEAAGLDRIFKEAGFEWRDSACSMCVGSNGDFALPGERCASTSPRNYENRQGRGVRTHLMSPAMAAAAAVTGRLTDVRNLG